MNIKKLLFPSLLVCTAMGLTLRLFAKRAPAKPVANSAGYDEIDAYVEEQMHRLNMPGVSLAIVEGDQIVHLRGFGRARPGGEAPSPQMPFPIGSITKSFTALAVMQLVEAGKIDLDAPVQRYLPWFRVADSQASAQMTIRHLLNQTSGLPASTGEILLAKFDDRPGATERQARALSTLVFTRPVGSAFEYSNSNYQLLGLIIAAASGESYADYIQKHILTPLGLSHIYTSLAAAKENGLAMGHQYWFSIPFAAPNLPIPPGALASAGLISSADDLARYMIVLLTRGRGGDVQILSRPGIDELQRGTAEVKVMGISLGKYGMGWVVDESGGTKTAWHSGTLPDFASFMALLPEQKKGVVLLFNASHHWMNPVLSDFGGGVAALLAGKQANPIPFVRMIPGVLRGQLLVPTLQIASVAATLWLLRRWHLDPKRRPSGVRMWGLHVLLSLVPNLLAALTLKPILSKRRSYLKLYMPDFSWVAMLCGSFSLVWSFVSTELILRTLQKPSSPQTLVGQFNIEREVFKPYDIRSR